MCLIWITKNSFFILQFPQELVTYGGNGQVFSNWAQVWPELTWSFACLWSECIPFKFCICVGAVPPRDALPERNDRGTNSGYVQRSPHGSFPQSAFLTSRHHHQRHGNGASGIWLTNVIWRDKWRIHMFFFCFHQVIPNYSSRDQYEKMFAMGVSM